MRFVVLLFGFSGVLLTGAAAFGYMMIDDVRHELTEMRQIEIPEMALWSPMLPDTRRLPDVGLFLGIAAVLGLLGTLMAFFRRGKQGAMLILIPILGAGFMNPLSFAFTGLLLLTAFACFFVGPLPLNAPKDDEDD
jgi:hypothetical protein